MKQWLNHSHPQTLQASVFLGYLSAVFGVIFGDSGNPLPALALPIVFIAIGVGAFFTANNRRWGYQLLAVAAGLIAATNVLGVVQIVFAGRSIADILLFVNNSVFSVALAAAVLHGHSREYQKIWFE